jgi:hypothetical protein
MSSSNRINYSIRVNKAIERKIIAEGVSLVRSKLGLEYNYIGFGSLWFSDFVYFHKILNISQMSSIERDDIVFERAKFNKPFSCIKMHLGESKDKLAEILAASPTPTLIWLDYDDSVFNCGSYLEDVSTIVSHAKSGSIFIVSMNAHNQQAKDFKNNAPKDSNPEDWKTKTKLALKNVFGNVDIESVHDNQLTNSTKFIPFVSSLFSETIKNSIYASGNTKEHFKIFDFSYADGAEMITQGFLILDTADTASFTLLEPLRNHYFINDNQFRISAPTLTAKEKYILDQRLPHTNIENLITTTGEFLHDNKSYLKASELGFPLLIDSLRGYSQLYKFYPTFSEILSS